MKGKLAKSILKDAVGEARHSEESTADKKHPSGGIFIAHDGALSSAVHK